MSGRIVRHTRGRPVYLRPWELEALGQFRRDEEIRAALWLSRLEDPGQWAEVLALIREAGDGPAGLALARELRARPGADHARTEGTLWAL